jgi:hypothetical protein
MEPKDGCLGLCKLAPVFGAIPRMSSSGVLVWVNNSRQFVSRQSGYILPIVPLYIAEQHSPLALEPQSRIREGYFNLWAVKRMWTTKSPTPYYIAVYRTLAQAEERHASLKRDGIAGMAEVVPLAVLAEFGISHTLIPTPIDLGS